MSIAIKFITLNQSLDMRTIHNALYHCKQRFVPSLYICFLLTIITQGSFAQKIGGKLTPKGGKTLFIVGQDLASVNGYINSRQFKVPGGITTYLSFHLLRNSGNPEYGALGQNPAGRPTNRNVDWGAGPLNAHKAAFNYRKSALVIGVNFANGNASQTWFRTGVQDIGNGRKSADIKRLADFCKRVGKPVYLRLGYECEAPWNNYVSPAAYKKAFRKIVDGVRAAGASNVAFVWHVSAYPDLGHPNIAAWYPGDKYVDWCGISWFLAPSYKFRGRFTSKSASDRLLNFAKQRKKPVMIAESAPQGYDLQAGTRRNFKNGGFGPGGVGQNRQSKTGQQIWKEWFAPYFKYIRDNANVIRAVAYINADWDSQRTWAAPYNSGYWGDTRVEKNAVIRNRWKAEMNKGFWLQGHNNIGSQLVNGGRANARQTSAVSVLGNPKVTLKPNLVDAHNTVKITGLKGKISYAVFGASGVEITKGQLKNNTENLEVSGLKPGLYYVKITNGKEEIVKRLVVK